MLRQRKRRQKRPSVVAIQQDDGSSYFYDDPDLGGTGETSWTREELDVLDEGEEEEDEQGKCFKRRRASAIAYMEKHCRLTFLFLLPCSILLHCFLPRISSNSKTTQTSSFF